MTRDQRQPLSRHGHAHHGGHGHAHDGPQPTVFVMRRELDLDGRHGSAALSGCIEAFVRDFAGGLAAAGCTLIGHVKGAIEDGSGGVLYFNTTGFATAPMVRGRLDGARVRLTLNAIVFGIAEDEVERVALAALARHLDDGGRGSCAAGRVADPD